jgi:hypothetical protein
MTNSLNQLLTALYSDSFDSVKIRTQPPRNETLNDFNQPHDYKDIKFGELTNPFSLVTKALTSVNEKSNVLVSLECKAVVLMISNLELINSFTLLPSAIIKAGELQFVLWILADKCDGETWLRLQNSIADKLKVKSVEYVPLPSFNFVSLTNSYIYEPIELSFLNADRRFTVAELEKAIKAPANKNVVKIAENRKSAETLKSAETVKSAESRKSAETSKGELTYQNFVRLIHSEMKSAEILKSAETNLGLKSRRCEGLLKSAVTRNDILAVRRGVYSPKSAEVSDGLPLAA